METTARDIGLAVSLRDRWGLQVCSEIFGKHDEREAKLDEEQQRLVHKTAVGELAARGTDRRTYKTCPAHRPFCQFPSKTVEVIRDNTEPRR